jgi:hypothetical protein
MKKKALGRGLEALIPDLKKFETTGEFRLDAKTSTELALSLNNSLAEFFKGYAERFTETQGKQVLITFANQESAHSDLLRQRMEGMLGAASAV